MKNTVRAAALFLAAFLLFSLSLFAQKTEYRIGEAEGGLLTDEKVKDADLVITGEGKMDSQSLMGKLPFGVAKRCAHTKVAAIVGLNVAEEKLINELGIAQVVETNPMHLPFEQVKASAKEDLFTAAKKIII